MHLDINLTIVVLNDSGFSVFCFQYSNISVFSIPSIHFTKRFQISVLVFNFQYSHIQIQTFQFSNFRRSTQRFQFSIFSFQLQVFTHPNSNILVLKFSNSKHFTYNFQFSIFSFQYSHIGIQTFQFSKFQIPNIPYIVVAWQVWHMPPKQLINFENSISKNKTLLKIIYFLS